MHMKTQLLNICYIIMRNPRAKPLIFRSQAYFFNRNVRNEWRQHISDILGVHFLLNHGRYLGFPSLIERNKRVVFSFIRDRIWKRIHGWKNHMLSKADKTIMITLVAQILSTYNISVFLISLILCNELQWMMSNF